MKARGRNESSCPGLRLSINQEVGGTGREGVRGKPRKGFLCHSNQKILKLFTQFQNLSSLSKRLFRQTGRVGGRPVSGRQPPLRQPGGIPVASRGAARSGHGAVHSPGNPPGQARRLDRISKFPLRSTKSLPSKREQGFAYASSIVRCRSPRETPPTRTSTISCPSRVSDTRIAEGRPME
jgi:hypothetical protein